MYGINLRDTTEMILVKIKVGNKKMGKERGKKNFYQKMKRSGGKHTNLFDIF